MWDSLIPAEPIITLLLFKLLLIPQYDRYNQLSLGVHLYTWVSIIWKIKLVSSSSIDINLVNLQLCWIILLSDYLPIDDQYFLFDNCMSIWMTCQIHCKCLTWLDRSEMVSHGVSLFPGGMGGKTKSFLHPTLNSILSFWLHCLHPSNLITGLYEPNLGFFKCPNFYTK